MVLINIFKKVLKRVLPEFFLIKISEFICKIKILPTKIIFDRAKVNHCKLPHSKFNKLQKDYEPFCKAGSKKLS